MNIHSGNRSGFTLVELMIVIAIIAILAAILVPNLIRARSKSQLLGCTTNLKNIATSAEMYSVDFKGKYPAMISGLSPNYLKTVPECPVAGTDTYSNAYVATTGPNEYEVFCEGPFHAAFAPTDYPRYTAAQGLLER